MLSCITFAVLLFLVNTAHSLVVCPTLKSAANFTVVAASSISNTGFTIINGSVAMSPSTSLTGFNPSGTINGGLELGTGVALQAQQDATSAYNDLRNIPISTQMTGVDLSGRSLSPGVYKFDSTAGISTSAGTLILNGTGIYIFQIGSALTTSANSEVRLINGARAGCVFWQIGSSATLGQYSVFVGNILAYASVGLSINVTYYGRIYAQTAAVTLNSDTIIGQPSCDVCQTISNSVQGTLNRNLPENSTLYIFIMFVLLLIK
ncbi:unnamed protein product [Adineta steineri]|uniref:Uncharacterized protein n=1 Tax=Adineta steineri TaxID=433720 RepID=A0A819CWF3_9BILA|nr:unnamed protein product [Adineta steineri]CAF3814216.1 unnamed protein product [Adineta steineri]